MSLIPMKPETNNWHKITEAPVRARGVWENILINDAINKTFDLKLKDYNKIHIHTWGGNSKHPTFKEQKLIPIQCGKCDFCVNKKQKEWTTRLLAEKIKQNGVAMFLSMTYAKEPATQGENKRNIQLFLKKLRQHIKKKSDVKIKYLSAGEFGGLKGRRHAHLIITGWRPKDEKFAGMSPKGHKMFKSKTLTKIWGHGILTIQDVTAESIQYCITYAHKEEETHATYKSKADQLLKDPEFKKLNDTLTSYRQWERRQATPKPPSRRIKWIQRQYEMKKDYEFNTSSKLVGWDWFNDNNMILSATNEGKIGTLVIPRLWLTKTIKNEASFRNPEIAKIFNNRRKPKTLEDYAEIAKQRKILTNIIDKEYNNILDYAKFSNEIVFNESEKKTKAITILKTRRMEAINTIMETINEVAPNTSKNPIFGNADKVWHNLASKMEEINNQTANCPTRIEHKMRRKENAKLSFF
ncbi:replication initiation protein [Tortoise microvirus 20]|nr:replication initiation protein [Tortoise microvirus 20]